MTTSKPESFNFYGHPVTFEQVAACVGPGWKALLRETCDRLFYLGWSGGLEQVKEKFGTLRFYFRNDCRDELAQLIAFDVVAQAEEQSGQVCEQCGEYGKLRGQGWVYTSCAKHAKEGDLEGYERKENEVE